MAATPMRFSTSYVPRPGPMRTVQEALAAGALVTLVGPGGVGKTRLAYEAMRSESLAAFVDLASAHSEDDVVVAVAAALDAVSRGPSPPAHPAAVGAFLAGLPTAPLVVLDNAEQAVPAVRAAVSTWIEAAPAVRWLVTSREALGHPDETTIPMAPLQCPSVRDPDAAIVASEAVALLISRAPEGARPGLLARPGLASELVRQLDGLPLAIELAAARLHVLGLEEVLQRLRDRFRLLRDPLHALPRHGALEATLDWSWQLLEPWERSVMVQASVFVGGFTLAAAEAVLSVDRALEPLDCVQALAAKSLIQVERVDGGPPVRFAMLESIREFSRERGSPEEILQARRRHARHTLATWDALRSSRQRAADLPAVRALGRDRENLLASYRTAIEDADRTADGPGQLALALELVFERLDSEGVRRPRLSMFDDALAALDRARGPDVPAARARVLTRSALAHWRQDLPEEGLRLANEALALATEVGEPDLLWSCHFALGNLADPTDIPAIRHQFELAMGYASPVRRAITLCTLAMECDYAEGKLTDAKARLEQAHALMVDGGHLRVVLATGYLGHINLELGDLEAAERWFSQTLDGLRPLELFAYVPDALHGLALVALLQGDRASARTRWEACVEEADRSDDQKFVALGRTSIAVLDAMEGDPEMALVQSDAVLEAHAGRLDPRFDSWMSATTTTLAILAEAEDVSGRVAVLEAQVEAAPYERMGELRTVVDSAKWIARAQRAWRADDRAQATECATRAAVGADRATQGTSVLTRVLATLLHSSLEALPTAAEAWTIAEDGSWFHPPGGDRVDLARRAAPRRILAAMATQPKLWTVEDFAGVGWPDEQILPKAAANRVYVALSTLRSLGLELVERTDTGWRLDPQADVVVARQDAAPS